jgi:hypothetical protein
MWWDGGTQIQDPARWVDDIDRLLHSGEEMEEEVSVGDSHVVVTTGRVIIFTPYADGENVRYVERPNVAGVETNHTGSRQLLSIGATVGLTGILLVAIGNTLDMAAPASLSDLSGEPVPGAGLAESMVSAIELIDTAFLALGVLLLANAAVLTGYYFLRRTRTVVVSVAGDEDVELVTREEENADQLVGRLKEAVAP